MPNLLYLTNWHLWVITVSSKLMAEVICCDIGRYICNNLSSTIIENYYSLREIVWSSGISKMFNMYLISFTYFHVLFPCAFITSSRILALVANYKETSFLEFVCCVVTLQLLHEYYVNMWLWMIRLHFMSGSYFVNYCNNLVVKACTFLVVNFWECFLYWS